MVDVTRGEGAGHIAPRWILWWMLLGGKGGKTYGILLMLAPSRDTGCQTMFDSMWNVVKTPIRLKTHF